MAPPRHTIPRLGAHHFPRNPWCRAGSPFHGRLRPTTHTSQQWHARGPVRGGPDGEDLVHSHRVPLEAERRGNHVQPPYPGPLGGGEPYRLRPVPLQVGDPGAQCSRRASTSRTSNPASSSNATVEPTGANSPSGKIYRSMKEFIRYAFSPRMGRRLLRSSFPPREQAVRYGSCPTHHRARLLAASAPLPAVTARGLCGDSRSRPPRPRRGLSGPEGQWGPVCAGTTDDPYNGLFARPVHRLRFRRAQCVACFARQQNGRERASSLGDSAASRSRRQEGFDSE